MVPRRAPSTAAGAAAREVELLLRLVEEDALEARLALREAVAAVGERPEDPRVRRETQRLHVPGERPRVAKILLSVRQVQHLWRDAKLMEDPTNLLDRCRSNKITSNDRDPVGLVQPLDPEKLLSVGHKAA